MSDIVVDDFAPFTFMTEGSGVGLTPVDNSWVAPSWVGDNRQRLEGYKFLAALIATVSRQYQRTGSAQDRKERREYGDAALLVEAAVNALIGEDVAVVVDDAETVDQAATRQDDLRAWADKEGLIEKMFEGEWDGVGLGDTVYTLNWSNKKGRVRLRVYNPGFYFPVLGDHTDDDYPRKLHLGWEYDVTNADGTKERRVRRITWWLEEVDGTDECFLSEGTWALDALGRNGPRRPDDFDESNAVWERNEDGQELHNLPLGIDFIPVVHVPNTPASQTHFGKSLLLYVMQLLLDIQAADSDIDKASATTGLPIIGVKRDAAPGLSQADIIARGSGAAPGYVPDAADSGYGIGYGSNGARKKLEYRPGTVIEGEITSVDTSGALEALHAHAAELRELLSANSQIPAEALGRVKASDVPSGVTLLIAWSSLKRLVRKMRLVRERKYPLLLSFVQRITIANGSFDGGGNEAFVARLAFGAFMPTDRAAFITEVVQLFAAKLITARTALQMLVDEGVFDIDVDEEVKSLEKAGVDAAKQLLALTQTHTVASGQQPQRGAQGGTPGQQGNAPGQPAPPAPPAAPAPPA